MMAKAILERVNIASRHVWIPKAWFRLEVVCIALMQKVLMYSEFMMAVDKDLL